MLDNGWIVKGAAALLARDISVRATIDVDIFRQASRQAAQADLVEAAARDLGDWFVFEFRAARPLARDSTRMPVIAAVGNTVWAQFHVDLVGTDLRMTGEPEDVPPLARVLMPGLEQHGYRAYPLVDHIADKVCAIVERHGPAEAPSTRYKDLVDLVAIVGAASIEADPQLAALRSEIQRRGLLLPERFVVPDRALWQPGYAAEARRSLLPAALTLDEAVATMAPFLDPILNGTARGTWLPRVSRWES
jgi:hypothetical protein